LEEIPLLLYYFIGGSVVFSLIAGYLWGNKTGHQQEQHSREATAVSLDAEIAQKKQWIEKLTESYETHKKLEQGAEKNLNLETERLLKIRDQQLLARQKDYSQKIASLDDTISRKQQEIDRLNAMAADARNNLDVHRQQALASRMADLDCQEHFLTEREKQLKENQAMLDSILHAEHADTPYFAKQFADCLYLIDLKAASDLENKARPAFTAAEKVREISSQKRALQEQCKLLEYQLFLYESVFPWLSDFKEISADDLASVANIAAAPESEYSTLRNWLSPQEYQTLSETDRLQLALDRYSSRQKSNWQVGIEYERYVGYCYEQKGYKVRYFGATEGLEDMGRDLIVSKGKNLFVIQCKRWASEKTIHEKHIFQLYGTTILQVMEHPECQVSGIFITTTSLSSLAKSCANYLHIAVVEKFPLKPYPLIKCNISRDGDKIYHLPFDQQYDRVIINPSDGDCYVSTVQEAESKGFRHAWRWHGS
jgi:HJR/Mrr/RecB family endonuclease